MKSFVLKNILAISFILLAGFLVLVAIDVIPLWQWMTIIWHFFPLSIRQPLSSKLVFSLHQNRHHDEIFWCISATWLGMSFWLWTVREEMMENIFKIFLVYYLLIGTVISSFSFVVCRAVDPSLGVNFYSYALGLGLILSFLLAKFWSLLPSLIRRRRF